jgi:hypothetical protein
MNVVGRTVNDQRYAVHLAYDTSKIGKYVGAKLWFDQRASSGCAEYEM